MAVFYINGSSIFLATKGSTTVNIVAAADNGGTSQTPTVNLGGG
jgi:hypothetical protein